MTFEHHSLLGKRDREREREIGEERVDEEDMRGEGEECISLLLSLFVFTAHGKEREKESERDREVGERRKEGGKEGKEGKEGGMHNITVEYRRKFITPSMIYQRE